MGIFKGIEILFFMLGALTVVLVGGLFYLNLRYTRGWKVLCLGALGSFLLIFCLAWSISSILEGEPQAANMGLLLFGLPVLAIAASFQRLMKKKINS